MKVNQTLKENQKRRAIAWYNGFYVLGENFAGMLK
jgi:hypothetical protein